MNCVTAALYLSPDQRLSFLLGHSPYLHAPCAYFNPMRIVTTTTTSLIYHGTSYSHAIVSLSDYGHAIIMATIKLFLLFLSFDPTVNLLSFFFDAGLVHTFVPWENTTTRTENAYINLRAGLWFYSAAPCMHGVKKVGN